MTRLIARRATSAHRAVRQNAVPAVPWIDWKLVDTTPGSTIRSFGPGCSSRLVSNVPAGRYRLSITPSGATGTYRLNLVVPDVFQVVLPASIADGVPGPGAGNLETAGSEDGYVFSTTASGTLKLAFSTCSASLGLVDWRLVSKASGVVVSSEATCGSASVSGVAAGQYRVIVTRPGAIGTYKLGISLGR